MAMGLFEKAFTIARNTRGPEDKTTLRFMRQLVRYLIRSNCIQESIDLVEELQNLEKRVLSDRDPEVAESAIMYANALSQFGNHQKAAEILESAFETLDVLSSPYMIWTKETLALIYSRLNRLQEAAELREQNLEASIRVYGSKHRETIKARVSLTWSYEKLDRPQDGIEILTDVANSARNTYGTDDPETIRYVGYLDRMLARYE